MDYESLDWESAAQRLGWAFGIEGECTFQTRQSADDNEIENESPPLKLRHLCGPDGSRSLPLKDQKLIELSAQYEVKSSLSLFLLTERAMPKFQDDKIVFCCNFGPVMSLYMKQWDGDSFAQVNDPDHALIFARGLGRLGLLTDEIEQALKGNVTAHEKLAWALDYEARYGL